MSRIGRKPISIPAGVKIAVSGDVVTVTGTKGTLTVKASHGVQVAVKDAEKQVLVTIPETKHADRQAAAQWGTTRALIQNAINGVVSGYEKQLKVIGVGWTAVVQGPKLKLTVGFANPLLVDIPKGLTVTVEKDTIKVAGSDRQMVGQFAAQTRALRKPEPYNGKGIQYTTETVRRKQGKQFGA